MAKYNYVTRYFDWRDVGTGWQPDDFTRGAITAAFFTANPLPESGEYVIDWDLTWNLLSGEEQGRFIAACQAFQAKFPKLLAKACEATGNDLEHAGRDYHYTSQGHGVGFWDGDWKANGRDYGDLLTKACKRLKLPEIHGELECEHFRETGEGCRKCDGCEAGATYWLE